MNFAAYEILILSILLHVEVIYEIWWSLDKDRWVNQEMVQNDHIAPKDVYLRFMT